MSPKKPFEGRLPAHVKRAFLVVEVGTLRPLTAPDRARALLGRIARLDPAIRPARERAMEDRRAIRLQSSEDFAALEGRITRSTPFHLHFPLPRSGHLSIIGDTGPHAREHRIAASFDLEIVRAHDLLGEVRSFLDDLIAITDPALAAVAVRSGLPRGGWRADAVDAVRIEGWPVRPGIVGVLRTLDVHWLQVYGAEYVAFLGRERLLAVDAFRTWSDSAGRVGVQLTETPEGSVAALATGHRERFIEEVGHPGAFASPDRSEVELPPFDRSALRNPLG